MNAPEIKLTSLVHGGGCGCKLADPFDFGRIAATNAISDVYATELGHDLMRAKLIIW